MDGVIIENIPVNRFFRKRVGFHFGMFVFVSIAEKHGIGMNEFEKLDNAVLTRDVLYFAAKWYAFDNNKKAPKISQIEKSINLMPAAQLQRIYKTMQDAKVGGKSIMQIVEEDKKKQHPKK